MANIVPPTWRLRHRRCPCSCDGEGFLVFLACPSCGATVLACDEVGTVFPDPHRVARGDADGPRQEPKDACARCAGPRCEEFRPATPDEIRALGFGPNDYQ